MSMIERLRAEAAARAAKAQSTTATEEPAKPESLTAKLAALKKAGAVQAPGSVQSTVRTTITEKLKLSSLTAASGKSAAQLGAEALAAVAKKQSDEAFERTQQLLERRRESGLYTLAPEVASRMPAELPASLLEERLACLDAALIAKTPEIRSLTMEISKNLRQYEELVHLLTDEQLSIVTNGLMDIAAVEVVQSKKNASNAAAVAAGAALTAEDFGF